MMAQAEFIPFNGNWFKDCGRCKQPYGAECETGLFAFFYKDRSRKDGFSNYCRKCAKVQRPTIVQEHPPRKESDV